MPEQKEWNVIFLIDSNPPSKIMMLKRAPDKKYAPNFYTGSGGKVDPEDKSIEDSAKRELQEETGLTNLVLAEIARVVLNHERVLYYYWGVYPIDELPQSGEGTLEWVDIKSIFEKQIIPDTKVMLTEWQKREFKTDRPFTLYLTEGEIINGVHQGEVESIKEGLLDL